MTVHEKKDAVKVIDRVETETNTDFQENISEKKEPLQEENIKHEVSGFSLSSIAVKKAAKKNNRPRDKKENLPKDSFRRTDPPLLHSPRRLKLGVVLQKFPRKE